ncbi:MAG: hypothetical protein IT530_12140 [Burkholderiales bacterium]|nr:hypothetical protein [Burkholderiales bacterium]
MTYTNVPISSAIRNAYIDFSKMTSSVVAVVTDVMRAGPSGHRLRPPKG